MRIIAHSDDPLWNTGFGSQLHNVMLRLKEARPDWEISALHWNHRGQPFQTAYGYHLLPDSGNGHFDNAKTYIDKFKPDLYLTLYDVWVSGPFMAGLFQERRGEQIVTFNGLSNRAGYSKTKWLSYYVLDVARWSPPRYWQHYLNMADIPVAMSNYGRETVLENYGVNSNMIYHGVDLEAFPPLPREYLQQRREAIGNPNFVLGALFRNIFRKQTARLIEAWSRVCREYPDVKLLTNMRWNDSKGFDVVAYLRHFNCADTVLMSNQTSETLGVPPTELNAIYQMCDAQILPTLGEGFGLPIIEGYAANGLPVIMSHNTTYDELVGDHGLPIKCNGYVWSGNAGAQSVPDTKDMEDCIRLMVDDVNLRKKFVSMNKAFVQNFDFTKKIIPKWLELIEREVGEGASQPSTLKLTASALAPLASS